MSVMATSKTGAADWLRSARGDLRISQEAFARLIGSTKANVSNYERGTRVPKDLVVPISRVTGKGLTETADALGYLVDEAVVGQSFAPPSVEDAIRAHPGLLPEAKAHLIAQLDLLLRIAGPTTVADTRDIHERALDAKLEALEQSQQSDAEPSHTDPDDGIGST